MSLSWVAIVSIAGVIGLALACLEGWMSDR